MVAQRNPTDFHKNVSEPMDSTNGLGASCWTPQKMDVGSPFGVFPSSRQQRGTLKKGKAKRGRPKLLKQLGLEIKGRFPKETTKHELPSLKVALV